MTTSEEFFYHLYQAADLYDDGRLDEARAALAIADVIAPTDARAIELRAKLDLGYDLVLGTALGSRPDAASGPDVSSSPAVAPASRVAPLGAPADPAATFVARASERAPAPLATAMTSASVRASRPPSTASSVHPYARRLAELVELTVPKTARFAVRLDSLRAFGAIGSALLERSPRIPGASALLGSASRPFVTLSGIGSGSTPGAVSESDLGSPLATALLGPRAAHRLELLPFDEDAPLFVREELLVAFDLSLMYECARLTDSELDVVQLRRNPSGYAASASLGPGFLPTLVDPPAPLARVVVSSPHPLHVRRDRLIAWTGRLLPQPIAAQDALASQRGLLRMSGDGAVLLSLA